MQSKDLVEVFSFHNNVWYCWVNRLNIAIIAFDNAATYLRTLNFPTLTEVTASYSKPQYLGLAL